MLSIDRKALISSIDTLYPQRWRSAYWSIQAWPLLRNLLVGKERFRKKVAMDLRTYESTNLSRLTHFGFLGL